jgi:hypothetical protein
MAAAGCDKNRHLRFAQIAWWQFTQIVPQLRRLVLRRKCFQHFPAWF